MERKSSSRRPTTRRSPEEKKPPSDNKKPDSNNTSEELSCGICFEAITIQGKLSDCAHPFCFVCIEQWSKTENSCPLCKTRFLSLSKIDLAKPNKKPQTVRVKQVDQRPPDVPPDSYIEFDDFLPFGPTMIPPPMLFNVHPVFNLLLNPLFRLNTMMFETSFLLSMGSDEEDEEDEDEMGFDDMFDEFDEDVEIDYDEDEQIAFGAYRNPEESQVIDLTEDVPSFRTLAPPMISNNSSNRRSFNPPAFTTRRNNSSNNNNGFRSSTSNRRVTRNFNNNNNNNSNNRSSTRTTVTTSSSNNSRRSTFRSNQTAPSTTTTTTTTSVSSRAARRGRSQNRQTPYN